MEKKKTHAANRPSLSEEKSKEEAKIPPAAQMVVEVEEEIPVDKKTIEIFEKDTAKVEEATQKLEEDIEKEVSREEAQIPDTVPAVLPEKAQAKDVVKEFFKPGGIPPEIPAYSRKGKGNSLFLWVVIVLVVAGLTGTVLTLAAGRKSVKLTSFLVKTTPTPTPTPAAAPTPTPSVSRADLKIQVLNGGGVAGAGSKMKDFLTGKGYTVGDTGNADNFDYQNTVIYVKPDKEVYLSLLKDDLKDTYTVGSASATLSTDVNFDAQVIVGQQ